MPETWKDWIAGLVLTLFLILIAGLDSLLN